MKRTPAVLLAALVLPAVMLPVLMPVLIPGPLWAQTGQPPSEEVEAELTEFPSFVGPDGVLRIGVRVTNQTAQVLDDLRISLAIYDATRTRSGLVNTFSGRLGSLAGSDTIAVDGVVAPGGTENLLVEKPLSEIRALQQGASDGAHPIRISLRSGSQTVAEVETTMVFFAELPHEPLRLGLIIPLHNPSIYTDPAEPQTVTSQSLERSIDGGRLSRILAALENFADVPVTIAPSGLLLDMLDDLAGGFRARRDGRVVQFGPQDPNAVLAGQFLDRLRLLASRPQTSVIPLPYSVSSLPGLVRSGFGERAQSQVAESVSVLRSHSLESAPPLQGWLVPGHLTLDERTIAELQLAGVDGLVLSPGSLREPVPSLTRSAVVEIETRSGPMAALIEDEGLSTRLQASDPIVSKQRFLADVATIVLERPAELRGVAAVTPLDWSPQGAEIEGILQALATAGWVRPVSPGQLLAEVPAARGARVQVAPLESVIDQGPELPSDGYFEDLRAAIVAIGRFADVSPPPAELQLLRRRVLLGESADWWDSGTNLKRARDFLNTVPVRVREQLEQIRAPGAQTITLTSRTGVLPLSIGSGLDYPVDVVVRLDSDKLAFPGGNRVEVADLRAPARTVEVQTIARATGTFPLRVVIQTPTGIVISESRLVIRSTAYSVVALAITGGAGVFLVGWWTVGAVRRRTQRPGGGTTGQDPPGGL